MRNILFICPNPVWGGAATANLAIAKMLLDNGHKVIFNDEYFSGENYNDVPVDHTPIHKSKFSNRRLLYSLVKDQKIDCIVWSPLVSLYFYREIIQLKKLGVKQISIVHSLSLTNDFKGKLMDFLVSLTLSQMSTIVYVSKYTMESWSKYCILRKSNAQQVVIHNLVDIQNDHQNKVAKMPRIGFVGRLSEEKQPKIFCDLSNKSKYDYCVYGTGPLLESLQSNYQNVNFRGECKDIEKIYAGIDILVMTSKFENCPMVILEAQSYGIPCVAPCVGGIPELIESGVNGILYEGYEPSTILSAIDEVLSKYAHFSSNCIEHAKIHTPKTIISQWDKILYD